MGIPGAFSKLFASAGRGISRGADEIAGFATSTASFSAGGFAGGAFGSVIKGSGLRYASIGKSLPIMAAKLGAANVLDEISESRWGQEQGGFMKLAMGLGSFGLRMDAARTGLRGVTGSALSAHGRMTGDKMRHFTGPGGHSTAQVRSMLDPRLRHKQTVYRQGASSSRRSAVPTTEVPTVGGVGGPGSRVRPRSRYGHAREAMGRAQPGTVAGSTYEGAMKRLSFFGEGSAYRWGARQVGRGVGAVAKGTARGVAQTIIGTPLAAFHGARVGLRAAGYAGLFSVGAARLGAGAASMPFKLGINQATKALARKGIGSGRQFAYSAGLGGSSLGNILQPKWGSVPGASMGQIMASRYPGRIGFGRASMPSGRNMLQRAKILNRDARAPVFAGATGLGMAAGISSYAVEHDRRARGEMLGGSTPGVNPANWGGGITMMPRGPSRNDIPNLTLALHRNHSRRIK